MARITFMAPIVEAALAALEANMPAHVGVFNAEANGVTLTDPAVYSFGPTPAMVEYPVVEAVMRNGSIGPFDVHDVEADSSPTLQILVWLIGDTGEVPELYRQALGYARCVIEILVEADAFGPDYGIANGDGPSVEWEVVGVLPADPADAAREIERWRIPVSVRVRLDGVERWQA